MEEIIKTMVDNDYEKLNKNICDATQLNKDDYVKLFDYLFFFYTKGKIDCNIMFCFIYLLVMKYGKSLLMDMQNLNSLITWHTNPESASNLICKFLESCNILQLVEMKVMTIVKQFVDSNGTLKCLITKCNTMEDLTLIINNDCKRIIGAYDDQILNANLSMSIEYLINNKIDVKTWMTQHEIEMKSRLQDIVKLFGLNLLKNMDIVIMSSDVYDKMEFNGKIKYYRSCINNIKGYRQLIENLLAIRDRIICDMNKFDEMYNIIVCTKVPEEIV